MIESIELHNSGSRLRKRCRWRWYKQEVEGYKPRKRAAALYLGTLLDRALKAFYATHSRETRLATGETFVDYDEMISAASGNAMAALEHEIEQAVALNGELDDTVTEQFDSLCSLARTMLDTYLEWAHSNDKPMEAIALGRQFSGYIGAGGDGIPLFYAGEFDGLILWDGALYILENKTSLRPEQLIASLDRDEQASRYHFAAQRMINAGAFESLGIPKGTVVRGTIFNIMLKRTPTAVKINKNKNKTISKVAGSYRTEDYLRAVQENRPFVWTDDAPLEGGPWVRCTSFATGEPTETGPWALAKDVAEWDEQHVPALQAAMAIQWVRRHVTDRNAATLAITEAQLITEAREDLYLREHPEENYRNPTFACAIDCPMLEPCTADLKGMPIDSLLLEFYTKKGEADPVVPDLEDDSNYAEMDISDVGF